MPKEGLHVYPCYACRDMYVKILFCAENVFNKMINLHFRFICKSSFLDHVNRRGMLITYNCSDCPFEVLLTFYNPCSFLLHIRQHFSISSGFLNLDKVNVSILPLGLIGLPPHPEIPMHYDVEEDNLGRSSEINTRFYSPTPETIGQKIVALVPNILMFDDKTNPVVPTGRLILKQISSNIPYCQFIPVQVVQTVISNPLASQETNTTTNLSNITIKEEPVSLNEIHTEIDLSEVPKQEILDEDVGDTTPERNTSNDTEANGLSLFNSSTNSTCIFERNCPECNVVQKSSMTEHFLKQNRPYDESLKCVVCRFIAPTECSLKAHSRLHKNCAPYVCPECGRDFMYYEPLMEHLDEVCFHLAKQVRFRCPAKNCGKIFAQTQTYSSHFLMHMLCIRRCSDCDINFLNKEQFLEHMRSHMGEENSQQLFKCTVCKDQDETFTNYNYKQHIHWHCTDRQHCVYIYLCKYCRSYFRSTLTYATHLLRCSKKEIVEEKSQHKVIVVTICLKCNYQVKLSNNMSVTVCPRCGFNFNSMKAEQKVSNNSSPEPQLNQCLLCNNFFSKDELEKHLSSNSCKYQSPKVVLKKLAEDLSEKEMTENDANSFEITDELSNFEPNVIIKEECKSPQSDISLKKCSPEPPKKKKRKSGTPKFKKNLPADSVHEEVLLLEEQLPFDGNYKCKMCFYTDENRHQFHEHIVTHRDISTSYQCMECGECFLVKPSLSKHLLFYHHISDVDQYLEENNCSNQSAMEEIKDSSQTSNQCSVCYLEFSDSSELNKHIRVHGMAFLKQNNK